MYSFLLTCFIIFSLTVTAASASTPPESQRSGREFGIVDINYFKLFPRIQPQSVEFRTHTHADSIVVQIKDVNLRDTSFAISIAAAEAIVGYVDHFEEIFAETYTPAWENMLGLVSAVRPFIHQKPVVVTTMDGKQVNGQLFWANDSLLVVCTAPFPSSWQTFAPAMQAIPRYNVASVDGRIINGNREMYVLALRWMKSRQCFLSPPPECLALIRSTIVGEPLSHTQETSDDIFQRYYLRRWHLTLYGGVTRNNAPGNLAYASMGKYEQYFQLLTIEPNVDIYAGINAAYSFSSKVHAVVSFSAFPSWQTNHITRKGLSSQREMRGQTFAVGVAYSLVAANPQLDDSFDWQVGAGLAYTDVSIHSALYGGKTQLTDLGTETASIISPIFSTSVQYFFSQAVSLDLMGVLIASAPVPLRGQVYDYDYRTIQPLGKSFDVDVSTQRFNLLVGVGLHL